MLAVDFVAKNALLNGTIEPYYFSEGTVAFDVASVTCVNTSMANKYLSTRLYKVLKSYVGLTPENMQKDTAALASRYQSKPGFLHYVGAIIQDEEVGDSLFFSNTYDNEESSKVANDFGTSAANTTQSGDSLLLVSTEGKIIFDYICTDDSTDKDVSDTSIKKEGDNSGSDGVRMAFSWWTWIACLSGLYALLF